MPIDYDVLRIIWWLLLGVLLIGFAIMDGMDFGVAMLLPWVAQDDVERRVVINSIGPVWESNQVWFILGGGAIFAAWPYLYAVAFSGFYLAMFILLAAFIFRPVAFKYRSKRDTPRWRTCWDTVLIVTGVVAPMIFGVAIGNTLLGVPFHFDEDLRVFYTGTLWQLLNPFALLCGVLSVSMLLMQGATYLAAKTTSQIRQRALRMMCSSALFTVVLFVLLGYWITYHISGYAISGTLDHTAPSNPLHKTIELAIGQWSAHYRLYPWLWLVPALGIGSAIFAVILLPWKQSKVSMVFSSLSVASIIVTVGVSMFPILLPSSTHPNVSLTVWDASSTPLTLFIMLVVTVIFMPIILIYVSWVYRVLRGKVTKEMIEKESGAFY